MGVAVFAAIGFGVLAVGSILTTVIVGIDSTAARSDFVDAPNYISRGPTWTTISFPLAAPKTGGVVELIAPASPVPNSFSGTAAELNATAERAAAAIGNAVAKYDPILYSARYHQYLSQSDAERADAFVSAFLSSDAETVMAFRGGYGCARMLDLSIPRCSVRTPSIVIGYSDLTALLTALYTMYGYVTFHGPMGLSDYSPGSYNAEYAKRVIVDGELVTFANPPEFRPVAKTISGGTGRGRLLGGNLSVFVSLLGSRYFPDMRGSVLFLEDVDEAPYRVDRMLQSLELAGVFDEISAFVWGTCDNCDSADDTWTVEDVVDGFFASRARPIPAFRGFMFGHIPQQFTLPVGAPVELDADAHTIRMIQSAVIPRSE